MAFENIRQDCRRNGIGFAQFLKALLVPNHFNAILNIRLHVWFEKTGLPRFIPYRWLLHVHGFELGTGCKIGPGLFLPHPRGVILTDGTVIGADCDVYGMVRFLRENNRTPVIGDRAFIGDGARFLGGVTVGDNVTVGAGALVLKDMESHSIVVGFPAKVVRKKTPAEGAPA